jgi:2-phosphoglycerate kinase
MQMEVSMYLVVWSDKAMWDTVFVDRYRTFDAEQDAQRFYEYLLSKPKWEEHYKLHNASICVCVKSTDYPCIKEVVWQSA